jgi:hypothetical protein
LVTRPAEHSIGEGALAHATPWTPAFLMGPKSTPIETATGTSLRRTASGDMEASNDSSPRLYYMPNPFGIAPGADAMLSGVSFAQHGEPDQLGGGGLPNDRNLDWDKSRLQNLTFRSKQSPASTGERMPEPSRRGAGPTSSGRADLALRGKDSPTASGSIGAQSPAGGSTHSRKRMLASTTANPDFPGKDSPLTSNIISSNSKGTVNSGSRRRTQAGEAGDPGHSQVTTRQSKGRGGLAPTGEGDLNRRGSFKEIHHGNPYQDALARKIERTKKRIRGVSRERNDWQLKQLRELLERLEYEDDLIPIRSVIESEEEIINRTGVMPAYCARIIELQEQIANPEERLLLLQKELEDLVGYRDDSPENEELIIQYTRVLQKLTRENAGPASPAKHGRANVSLPGHNAQ